MNYETHWAWTMTGLHWGTQMIGPLNRLRQIGIPRMLVHRIAIPKGERL